MSKRLAETAAPYDPANALAHMEPSREGGLDIPFADTAKPLRFAKNDIRTLEFRHGEDGHQQASKPASQQASKQVFMIPRASTRATEGLSIRIESELKRDLDIFVQTMKIDDPGCSLRDVVHASIRAFIEKNG